MGWADVLQLDLDRWKYRLPGPSLVPGLTSIERIERWLTDRAENLGVTILGGNGVAKITTQDNDGVTVEAKRTNLFTASSSWDAMAEEA